MDFEIIYYKNSSGKKPVEIFLLALGKKNKKLQAKTFEGIIKLKSKIYHNEPLSKYIESGLWELRVKSGTDILRIIYTFSKGRLIILLHVFIKKQQNTLQGDLEIARKRLKEVRLREAN